MTTIGIVLEVAPKKALVLSAYRRLSAPRLILPPAYAWDSWAAFVPLVTSKPREIRRGDPVFVGEPAIVEPRPLHVYDFSPRRAARKARPARREVTRVATRAKAAARKRQPAPKWMLIMRGFVARGVSWLTYTHIDTAKYRRV